MKTRPSALLAAPLLIALLAAGAAGQSGLFHVRGDGAGDEFGRSVAGIGNVDWDGIPDFAVGAPLDDNSFADAGSVRVYSGATGAVLHTFNGAVVGDQLGFSVAGAGDVDWDLVPDVAVGIPKADGGGPSAGAVQVFSGFNGVPIHTFLGVAGGDEFGYAVDGAGDVNWDGFDDVIVGAPFHDVPFTSAGMVQVLSGADASVLHTIRGTAAFGFFGRAVAGVGDLDSDGHDEFLVGQPGGAGQAVVFLGVNGAPLYPFAGATGEQLGHSVSSAGFVNLDSVPDFVIGTRVPGGGAIPGAAYVFSGVDGSLIHTLTATSNGTGFGNAVAGAGDFDADGRDDILVGEPFDVFGSPTLGRVHVFSGATGGLLRTYPGGSPYDAFGASVAGVGDANGDGFDDLLVGAPEDDDNGADSGSATLFAGGCSDMAVYCTSKVNSLGCTPRISGTGIPSASFPQSFLIDAREVINNKNGILFYGLQSLAMPFQGGTLCAKPPLKRTPVQSSGGDPPPNNCSGFFTFDMNLWIQLGLDANLVAGVRTYCQYWYRDPASPSTTGLSDALAFTICD